MPTRDLPPTKGSETPQPGQIAEVSAGFIVLVCFGLRDWLRQIPQAVLHGDIVAGEGSTKPTILHWLGGRQTSARSPQKNRIAGLDRGPLVDTIVHSSVRALGFGLRAEPAGCWKGPAGSSTAAKK